MLTDLEIPISDNNLLEDLAEKEGRDVMDMLSEASYDSVVPGICPTCRGIQSCDPDARANYCEECQTNTVRSCLDIAGII